jgi:hypothetical protein
MTGADGSQSAISVQRAGNVQWDSPLMLVADARSTFDGCREQLSVLEVVSVTRPARKPWVAGDRQGARPRVNSPRAATGCRELKSASGQ